MLKESQERLAHRALQDLMEPLVRPVPQAHKENRALQESPGLLVPTGRPGRQDQKVLPAQLAPRVSKDLLESPERPAHRVQLVLKGSLAQLVLRAQRALTE